MFRKREEEKNILGKEINYLYKQRSKDCKGWDRVPVDSGTILENDSDLNHQHLLLRPFYLTSNCKSLDGEKCF